MRPDEEMELLTDTTLEVAWRVWQARPPAPSLTVVVKGTFTIPEKGVCQLADEQVLPTGELYFDDDVERSLRYPSDMDPLKTRGECFVVGSFRTYGKPVQRSAASFEIGRVKKQLVITGDRYWRRGRATEPQPFEMMELSWERSFGGPKNPRNPVGRGVAELDVDGEKRVALPNIEDAAHVVLGRGDAPAPFCSAPIPRTWASRRALSGTYDAVWQATRYPWFPADIDWRFFNSAPVDQQIDGYWNGDEELSLKHLHPRHANVSCRLPGLRAHAFLVGEETGSFTDVGLALDTITVDADAGLAYCVWRGVTEVAREDLSDIRHLYVAHHERERAPGLDGFRERYAAKVASTAVEEQAEERAGEVTSLFPDPNDQEVISLAAAAHEPGAQWAHLDQALTMQGGSDALALAFRHAASQPGVIESVLKHAIDLERPLSADRELSSEELLELEMFLALSTVIDPREKDAGRIAVKEALAAGETNLAGWNLSAADLSGLDLTELDLRGAILVRANLSSSNFGRCHFDNAILSGAELSRATFDACSFRDASLDTARAPRVRFHRCVFDDAEMPGAYLSESRFADCEGLRTVFARSDLAKADFRGSKLDGADFGGATLDDARFRASSLNDASFEGATALRLNLDGCDATLLRASQGAMLDGASFRQTKLDGARFGAASLRRADFSLATLERANFMAALLLEATFTGCDLRAARFDAANLTRATLVRANLMQARLEGANLSFADLRGASLFQAELLGATLADARMDVAQLVGTRLA